MRSLDPVLDSANDEQMGQFTEADTLNHLAFLELKSYENNKTFLYKHPILLEYKQENELRQLLYSDVSKFMAEITLTQNNINRYKSYINTKRYKNEEEKNAWFDLIKDHNTKLSIMQRLISK